MLKFLLSFNFSCKLKLFSCFFINRERRFGKMSQINSGESLDTADEFSSSEKERKQQPDPTEMRLSLKERQARRQGRFW